MEQKEIREEINSREEGTEKKSKGREILDTLVYLGVVVVVTMMFILFVAQRTQVSGSSMYPTLHDRDNLIVDKISYRFREPERFDVIVFPYKLEKRTYFIKRIIGLPGETVQIDDLGNIYIDGEILEEDYGYETIQYAGLAAEPITLGKDEYFVLGDNRNNSEDSRFEDVGIICKEEIIGRAWVRIFPFKDFGLVNRIDPNT